MGASMDRCVDLAVSDADRSRGDRHAACPHASAVEHALTHTRAADERRALVGTPAVAVRCGRTASAYRGGPRPRRTVPPGATAPARRPRALGAPESAGGDRATPPRDDSPTRHRRAAGFSDGAPLAGCRCRARPNRSGLERRRRPTGAALAAQRRRAVSASKLVRTTNVISCRAASAEKTRAVGSTCPRMLASPSASRALRVT